jgi:carboxyl-terminal processing protease
MKRAGGIFVVALLVAAAFFAGWHFTRTAGPPSSGVGTGVRDVEASAGVLAEMRRELASAYYRAVGPAVLYQPTIAETLAALGDPYTAHLSAEEYDSLRSRTARSYTGVGLTVESSPRGLLVTSALEGPARKAGIRRGDLIVRIDGQRAGSLSFEESLSLITGETGTLVRLTVVRPGQGALRFALVREQITAPSLRTRLLSARHTKVGYVRLISFRAGSAARVQQATQSLVRQGARGLVLDLRANPGGLISQAVETVSIFVENGVVCTTSGLHQERRVYRVSSFTPFPKLPLVVLVDGGSASAAEIVAAALRDHGRAVVVGSHTFGKASIQSIRPLSDGTALKLTTATYLTPKGLDLSRHGVRPRVRAVDKTRTPADEALLVAERTLIKLIAQR